MVKIKCILPENLRDELKKPLGILLDDYELYDHLRGEKLIVSVGDYVTYSILKKKIIPLFCIVDYKTKRENCDKKIIEVIKTYGDKIINIRNPAGCISESLWDSIKESYNEIGINKIRIEVDGEEDLATLPSIYLSPNRDVTIIYGLPDKGVVLVKTNEENKLKVKKILDKM
jgi:uncharacterized protein (UPF0218 family)